MLAATAVVVLSTGQTLANIIILSLTILAVTFVALGVLRTLGPLVEPESAAGPRLVAGRSRAALEREKTLVLRAIKELEFDFSMGKLSQVDFDQMGGRLRGRAIALIQQLDRGEYRAQIERELVGRLGTEEARAGAAPPRAKESPEARSKPDPACPSCETVNDADARFCKQCGTRL
jgi:hypothetical protein